MAAAASAVQGSSAVSIAPVPHFVEGTLRLTTKEGSEKTFTITPLLTRDKKEMAEFLSTTADKYYRDGTPYKAEAAVKRVETLAGRHLKGDPWSAYVIRDENNTLAGMWTIGYDDEPTDLHFAALFKEEFRRGKLGISLWKWTAEHLFPHLDRQDAKVNGKPLKEAMIRFTTHPDHLAQTVEKMGFTLVRKYKEEGYEGKANDGRRNLYEMSVKDAMERKW